MIRLTILISTESLMYAQVTEILKVKNDLLILTTILLG